MDELLEQFLIEGRDLVLQAQADLAVLLADPADARAIDGVFRAIHTLKGSVGIFDMAAAERVLHANETVLERARKSPAGLPVDAVPGLVASLDQIDRWIDEMERSGALGIGADAIAARLLDTGAAAAGGAAEAAFTIDAVPPWVTRLIARENEAFLRAAEPLVAFRYTPDGDAFFRGDDPIALAATVPAMVALAILPADGEWPDPATMDPFACRMVIEGLSGGSLDDLRAIFRLVPDQIALHGVAASIATAPTGPATGSNTILRVDAARVDALADGVGELAVASNAFSAIADRADQVDVALALAIRAAQADMDRAISAVHRSVSAVRLVPLAPALARLPRLVREIAADLGKAIAFGIDGDQTEVDKQIADGLFEPLLHLLRNAIDHGIEMPAARVAAGKPAEGKVSLAIARDGENIVVTLADDGAGIDPARIRAMAVARGLIDHDTAAAMTDTAALALIFAPGFSTAAAVTDVSGRGVGMDAVQAAVDRLRGRIEIDSRIGEGTRFLLHLPANALTTRLLVIEVGQDRYAVPFDQITETTRVGGDRLMPLGTGIACVLRDRTVPVLSLAELLGGVEAGSDPARLLVTSAGGERVALRVDGFRDRIDAMVRPPTGLLAGVPSVAGTTLLGDGGVLIVLNLPDLVA